MYPFFKKHLVLVLLLSLSLISTAYASETFSLPTSSGDELSVERFPAKGEHLLVWVAPEFGIRGAHHAMAKMLAEHNIEVWISDILEALFLPRGSTSMKKLDGSHVADLVEAAHKKTGKKILLVGDLYGSIAALIGAHQWQKRKIKQRYLSGVILFTPYTYASIPPLGQLPEYMPIVEANNVPIMIYQSQNTGNEGQFQTLIEKLQQHGAPVYSRITPKVMSLFFEDKPDEKRNQEVKPIIPNIKKMISVLERYKVPVHPVELKTAQAKKSGIDIYLKKYQGKVSPLPIDLLDAHQKRTVRKDYTGKVTVINFWATWCPPCVEEIPSFNRLKQKMQGKNFELISVNYAEDKDTIIEFMKKVDVEFPVLLDPNGMFAQQWNVIAYPSTFVIDTNGHIVYGVNAAIEWDTPEIIEKLNALLTTK